MLRILNGRVGTRVELDVRRAGQRRTVALTLATPPEKPARSLTRITGENLLTGVTIGNLSPAFAQEIGAGLRNSIPAWSRFTGSLDPETVADGSTRLFLFGLKPRLAD